MPTVDTILNNAPVACVLAGNEIDKGILYGKRLDPLLPQKIYITYTIIKKIYDSSGISAAVNAIGSLTVTDIGNDGDMIEVDINDPYFGGITLGTYTKVTADSTATILAASIANALQSNMYGYAASSTGANVYITARAGLGSTINGQNLISVIIT